MSSPDKYTRDERGLLTCYPHHFNEDGSVNWRAMLLPEHLYVNPDYEKELKMQFGVTSRRQIDVTKVEDRKLLVLLDGWRHLLKLRGFKSVNIKMDSVTPEKASATCSIELIGNYETGNQPITFSDSASASLYSVTGSFQLHLEAMAANRAFVRCVRAALGVKIYGKDEFDADANAQYIKELENGVSPQKVVATTEIGTETSKPGIKAHELVRNLATEKGFTFEQVRKSAQNLFDQCKTNPELTKTDRLNQDPSQWVNWESIDGLDCYTLLTLMKRGEKTSKVVSKVKK